MGRSLEVKRKSENLPAISKAFIGVLAIWNILRLCKPNVRARISSAAAGLRKIRFCDSLQTVVPFAGTAVFFIGVNKGLAIRARAV